MAKTKTPKKQNSPIIDDIDFEDLFDSSYDEGVINDMVSSVIESTNHQMSIAFDLTKLIVENSAAKMDEKQILETFQNVAKVVSNNQIIKEFFSEHLHK